jgi:hypothetical protein
MHSLSLFNTPDPKERFSPGPYWEHLDIEITGLVLSPENLKNRVTKMAFLASRNSGSPFLN